MFDIDMDKIKIVLMNNYSKSNGEANDFIKESYESLEKYRKSRDIEQLDDLIRFLKVLEGKTIRRGKETMEVPRVFVVNRSSHDYSAAKDYGRLTYLSDGLVNRYKTNNIHRKFKKILENVSPDDYLLVTSLPELNIVATGIIVTKHGKINLLIFQPKTNDYTVRTVDFSNTEEDSDET